jgi:hypothetical protein
MSKNLSFFGLALLFFCSCSTTKYINQAEKGQNIKEMAYFETHSFISHIESGNKGIYNDSLSNLTKSTFETVLSEFRPAKIVDKKIFSNPNDKRNYLEALNKVVSQINSSKDIAKVRIPPFIDSTLNLIDKRFVLASVINGFDRKKGNYSSQVAKGVGIGLLTLGMYTPVPYKSNISMHLFVFDSKSKKILFYGFSKPNEDSPTNRPNLVDQFNSIFDGYLYNLK